MTASDVIAQVAARALDWAGTDYNLERLKAPYRAALQELSARMALNNVDAVRETHFRRLRTGSTVFNFEYHGIPNRTPHDIQIAPLMGHYSLANYPPVNVEDGVQIQFEQAIAPLSNVLYISGERRQPVINGSRGVILSEDKMAATVLDVRGADTLLADDVRANAGTVYLTSGGWTPVGFSMNPTGSFYARFVGGEIVFTSPLPYDTLIQVVTKGFYPDYYLEASSPMPVPDGEQFLIPYTLALAMGDRQGSDGPPMHRMREAEGAWILLLDQFVKAKQKSAGAPDYRIVTPSRWARIWSW